MTRTTVVAMSGDAPAVRDATERDAEACAGIYAPYVTDTAISFERDPPLPAEMALRIAAAARTHAWVVLEDEGRVVGYAYGCPYKSRAAYRWSCEVSVYLERGRRRGGGGRALYEALFTRLAERGFRTAVAGMTLPNDASVGCTAPWGSNRSGSTGTSASSTAGGTTSPGPAGDQNGPGPTRRSLVNAIADAAPRRSVKVDRAAQDLREPSVDLRLHSGEPCVGLGIEACDGPRTSSSNS